MVWFGWLNFFHDLLNMRFLNAAEQSHNHEKHNTKAWFLHCPLSDVWLVCPCGSLSAFTEGDHLTGDTEPEGGQGLDGVVEVKFLSADVWGGCRVVRLFTTIDHLHSFVLGGESAVHWDGGATDTHNDEKHGGALGPLGVFGHTSLGVLDLLDFWINWGLLKSALLLWCRHVNRHIYLHYLYFIL